MVKNFTGINNTTITCFPGINITRLSYRISQGHVDLQSAYNIILHVGANDISSTRTELHIMI